MPAEPLPAPTFPAQALHTLGRRSVLGAFTLQLFGCAAQPAGGTTRAGREPPDVHLLEVPGATLELQFAPGLSSTTRALAQAWVRRSAAAVAGYFGRFPVPQVEVLIVPEAGAGVLGGASFGEPEALLRLRVGRATTQAQFSADWVLVHEMIHLAIPRLPRAHNWLHEGLATYLEALVRGRAGLLPADCGLARLDAPDAAGPAARQRHRPGPQPRLGSHLLGRRAVLSARRCAAAPARHARARPAAGTARRARGRAVTSGSPGQ